jgi:hypothetical protein
VDNVGVGISLKELLLCGCLDGVVRREDVVKLLKSAILGLGDEEVEDDGLADTPDAEDNVGLPRDVLESNRDTELHDKHSGIGEERAEGHTLGSDLVTEDLDRVEGLERSPTNGVEDLEEVDPGQNSLADRGSDCIGLGLVVEVGNVGNRGGDSDTDPAKSTNKVDNEKHGTATDSVSKKSSESGEDNLDSVHAQGDLCLCPSLLDTGGVEESTEVVGDDTVASPLAEKRDETVAGETVDGGLVAEQSTVVPPSLVATVHLKMFLVLMKLELDPFAVRVSMTVELDEVVDGQLLSTASVQPTRGLREQHGKEEDGAREHELKANRDHPRGVGSLVGPTTEGGTASNEGTDRPHDVVETSDDTTVSRVRDLNDVGGTSGSGDGDTETKEEAASHELINTSGLDTGDLDNDTDDDDERPNGHTGAASPSIDSRTNGGNSDDGTNLVHGSDDTWRQRLSVLEPHIGSNSMRHTGSDTLVINIKKLLKVIVGEKSSKKRTVVTVGGGAAEGDHTGEDEDRSGDLGRGLLDQGLLEGLITNGRLDNGDLVLRLPKEVSICSIALVSEERRTFFSSCVAL